MKNIRIFVILLMMFASVLSVIGAAPLTRVGAVSSQVIYNSISSPLVYYASQAWGGPRGGLSEMGEQVQFSSTGTLGTATVTMSDWACQTGGWGNDDCSTTPGATYPWPITLNIYDVATATSPCPTSEITCPTIGALIATQTTTFNIPYRPSYDPTHCSTGTGEWYNPADGRCHNGYNFDITFDFTGENVVLPSQIIFGIAYTIDTTNGSPSGTPDSCFTSTRPACSLNVAYVSNSPSVGTDLNPDALFRDASAYCDGAVTWTGSCTSSASGYDNVGFNTNGPLNVFRQDLGWTGYRLSVEFTSTIAAVGGYLQPINTPEILSTMLVQGVWGYWWFLVIGVILTVAAIVVVRRYGS